MALGAPGAGIEGKGRRCAGQEGGDEGVGRREPESPGGWRREGQDVVHLLNLLNRPLRIRAVGSVGAGG